MKPTHGPWLAPMKTPATTSAATERWDYRPLVYKANVSSHVLNLKRHDVFFML